MKKFIVSYKILNKNFQFSTMEMDDDDMKISMVTISNQNQPVTSEIPGKFLRRLI